MSLRTKLKGDTALAQEGVWFKFTEYPNEDGTVPAFKMARLSAAQNKTYALALRQYSRDNVTEDGTVSQSDDPKDDYDKDVDVFVESILLDWENFQPYEDVNLAFSPQAARKVLKDTDWSDFYAMLVKRASNSTNFRDRTSREEDAGN